MSAVSGLKTWGWGTLGAIAALLSIPAYPFWSLAVFALCVVIIHQIAAHGTEGRNDRRAGPPGEARDRPAMTTGSGPR